MTNPSVCKNTEDNVKGGFVLYVHVYVGCDLTWKEENERSKQKNCPGPKEVVNTTCLERKKNAARYSYSCERFFLSIDCVILCASLYLTENFVKWPIVAVLVGPVWIVQLLFDRWDLPVCVCSCPSAQWNGLQARLKCAILVVACTVDGEEKIRNLAMFLTASEMKNPTPKEATRIR